MIGNGALFISDAKSRFDAITKDRYKSLCGRMNRKGIPLPKSFSLDRYRSHALEALRGEYDGVITCRYCRQPLGFADAVGDHAVPLSRGGSPELNNMDFICERDNDIKGSMCPEEYEELLKFLEAVLPLARPDVLARLQKANKLAAGMRGNMARITELKKTGEWEKAGKRTRKRKPSRFATSEEPF